MNGFSSCPIKPVDRLVGFHLGATALIVNTVNAVPAPNARVPLIN